MRRGTAHLFLAVAPGQGWQLVRVTRDRTAASFAAFVRAIVNAHPFAHPIHRVLDNLITQRRQSLAEASGEREGGAVWSRRAVHSTPTHASGLNPAAFELSLLSRECLGCRRSPDLATLARDAEGWRRRLIIACQEPEES